VSFAASVARLHAELKRQGIDLQDMRAERHLETTLVALPEPDYEPVGPAKGPQITWQEPGTALCHPVPATRSTGFRYFLDGTQRTLPAFFSSSIPIIASITAAAVLERDTDGNCAIMRGMLRLKHTWIAPRRSGDPAVARFIAAVERQGVAAPGTPRSSGNPLVIDPIDPNGELDDPEYQAALGDFGRLVNLSYDRARLLRQDLEEDLLEAWAAATSDSDGWIVVDGALRNAQPRMVGLVKSFTRQYLTGEAAAALLRLPPGHRSPAFEVHDSRPTNSSPGSGWRGKPVVCWYLRLRDATGRDPRYGLVRVETDVSVRDTAQIDELSSWILAERIPSATADARWATLLYPVHYLEQILKRSLEAETRGWPSPR